MRIVLILLAVALLNLTSRPAAAAIGLEKAHGVLVRDVALGGPSAAAGFQRGDLIVRLDGKAVEPFKGLIKVVRTLNAGDRIKVTVLRQRKTVDLTLDTGKWPAAWRVNEKTFASFPAIGVTVASMSDQLRKVFAIRWGSTGVVATLVDNSKGLRMDLKRGELILQVNQEPIWTAKQFEGRYRAAKKAGRPSVLLLVESAAGFGFSILPVR